MSCTIGQCERCNDMIHELDSDRKCKCRHPKYRLLKERDTSEYWKSLFICEACAEDIRKAIITEAYKDGEILVKGERP